MAAADHEDHGDGGEQDGEHLEGRRTSALADEQQADERERQQDQYQRILIAKQVFYPMLEYLRNYGIKLNCIGKLEKQMSV